MKTFLLPRSLCVLLLLGSFASLASAAAPDLRYQFKAGSNHVYSLKLEANEPKFISTLEGTVTYNVKSATADSMTLVARGALRTARKGKEGAAAPRPPMGPGLGDMLRVGGFRFGMPHMGGPFGAPPDEVEINAKGQVVRETGDTTLPQALGALSRLVVEPLAAAGESPFELAGNCTLILEEKVFRTPMTYTLKEVRLPAKEKTVYTYAKATGDTVTVTKTYEMKTLATVGGVPRFELKGAGTNVFDAKLGLFRTIEFNGTIVESTENVTVRTPLTLIAKLLEGAEIAAAQKAAALPPKAETKPLSADDRTSLLADLRSPDKARRSVAISRFGTAKPEGNKAEIAAVLLPLMKDTDHFTRQNVAKALGIWGDADAVEPLLALLTDPQFNVRWAAIEALGALQDPRAAATLARMIADKKETFQCSQALKVLGRVAEPEVLKLLADTRPETRREACQILKTIGSSASLPALEKAASDGDQLTAMFAKQALKDVKERK
ncbi:hypothetical protein LBMAG56_01830 [Verrucomicrobiota bacterium]|nr:hypothetical protein LBMAG56_01830 [Verrucomicrobiota bacterium]